MAKTFDPSGVTFAPPAGNRHRHALVDFTFGA
jgi:hypothetical protein